MEMVSNELYTLYIMYIYSNYILKLKLKLQLKKLEIKLILGGTWQIYINEGCSNSSECPNHDPEKRKNAPSNLKRITQEKLGSKRNSSNIAIQTKLC